MPEDGNPIVPDDLGPEVDFAPQNGIMPASEGGFVLEGDEIPDAPSEQPSGADHGLAAPGTLGQAAPATEGETQEEKPATAPDGKPAFEVLEGGKYRFGDKELTPEEVTDLLAQGSNVGEQQKAATQKFQEASELRKQIEQDLEKHKAVVETGEYLASLPPQAQQELFEAARQIEAKYRGGTAAAGDTPASAPAASPQVKLLDGINRDELNPMGQSMYDAINALASQNATMAAMLHRLDQGQKQVGEVLPEVRDFVNQTKSSAAVTAAAQSIKAQHGIEVAPADFQAAMQSTGVTDPEAAWLKANQAKIAEAAAAKVAAVPKGPSAPEGESRKFSTKGLTADQIFNRMQQGMVAEG